MGECGESWGGGIFVTHSSASLGSSKIVEQARGGLICRTKPEKHVFRNAKPATTSVIPLDPWTGFQGAAFTSDYNDSHPYLHAAKRNQPLNHFTNT